MGWDVSISLMKYEERKTQGTGNDRIDCDVQLENKHQNIFLKCSYGPFLSLKQCNMEYIGGA